MGLLLLTACTTAQQDALNTMVAAIPTENAVAVQPTLNVGEIDMPTTATPAGSTLNRPTPLPTMSGPMGTLTAIAPLLASPTFSGTPYQIVYAGRPVFIEFHAWW